MKKLFAILMSFQLVIAPVAMAQEAPAVNTGATDAYIATGTGSSGGYDFYMNQILVLATSAIGGSIISQCLEGLKTPSIATFMAGSVVHMMAEIVGAKAKNERHQKKLASLRLDIEKLVKKGDTAQKAALESMLQEEKDTLEFLENRKKWMIAVTTIYGAAMGLAIAEEVYGLASGSSTATAFCSAYTASCTVGAAFCGSQCAAGVVGAIAEVKAVSTIPQAREQATAYCTAFTPGLGGCQSFVQTYINLVYGACLMLPTDGGALSLSWGTLLSLAYGFGSSKLGSGGGKISQYGSMVLSLLNLAVPSFSKLVVSMYNFPIPRSITFGAAAVFTGTVTAGLASRAKKAEGNVGDLETVLANFKLETTGTEEIVVDPGSDEGPGSDDPNIKNNKPKLKGLIVNKPKECFSKGAAGMEHSASACSRPLKISKPGFNKFNLPAIGKVSGLATDLANALANGDNAKAGALSGEIGSYAARVKAETEELKARYNAIEKQNNRPTKDFDKSIKAQVAAMQNSMNNAAAAGKVDLASLGGNDLDDPADVKDTTPVVTSVAIPGIPQPPVDPFAGMGGTEESTLDAAPATADKSAQSLDDFESTEQDVSKKSEVSIFKQLSNRYILNYTKMFERKKTPEVVEEPKKN